MSITDGLRKGDTVVHSRIMEVRFAQDGYVELVDTEQPLTRIGLFDGHQGSDKIEVVKKAKPSVGTVLTGAEVADTDWTPGVVIESCGVPFLLTAEGEWIGKSGSSYSADRFRRGVSKYKLLHVA